MKPALRRTIRGAFSGALGPSLFKRQIAPLHSGQVMFEGLATAGPSCSGGAMAATAARA